MNNNIAIVTGGSSGLGFEIATKLVEHGHNVYIVSRSATKLQSARNLIVAKSCHHGQVFDFPMNIAEEQNVKSLYEDIASKGFTVSHLFNVAGVGRFGAIESINREMIDTVFEANLIGLILMTSCAMRAMHSKGGVIVNVMSTAALVGRSSEAIYCASKWGARGFTEALKVSLKGSPIRVISVYPGGMNTPFWSADCGISVDVSKFMQPADVAARIVYAANSIDSSICSDVTINKLG